MKPIRLFLIIAISVGLFNLAKAQTEGVSINSNGSNPDPSAMLDVSSTTKGMLAPRMTASQRQAIQNPAQGLLVYQTDASPSFYVFDGSQWTAIGSNGGIIPGQGLALDSCINIPVPDVINQNAGGAFQTTMYWQGFKANRTANLIGVSTDIWSSVPLDGYFRIYKGEGVSGQLLYQATIGGDNLMPYFFWDNPIPLEKDSIYTMQVEDTLNTVSWGFGGGDSYPFSTSNFGQDLNFTTYVDSCGSIQVVDVNNGSISLNQVDTLRFADGTAQTTAAVDTDDQTLSLSGSNLSIADGNTVDLSPIDTKLTEAEVDGFVSNNGYLTTEVDGDVTNEIQTLNKSGSVVSLSNGGGSFTDEINDADSDATNEIQTLSKSGSTVILSNGGGSFTDEIDDADADATNEIQTLSLSGSNLTISGTGGNTVNLPLGNSSYIQDSDANTQIQTEESPNENIIRFDIDGTERMNLNGTRLSLNTSNGIYFPFGFGPDTAFVGSEGNAISFGHSGISEDFIGYANNTFYFKDSPGGGDVSEPNISVDGTVFAGTFSGDGTALTGIDIDSTNEIQTLTLSNDTLSLTNGGFVQLSSSVPDTALPVPIRFHGSEIFVHPTENATEVDWTTAQTTCSNLTAFGFSDWYLPTRLELDAMYKQSFLITGLAQNDMAKYWSNTEFDVNNAYTQRLDYGGPDPDDKTDTTGHNCRCIRKNP